MSGKDCAKEARRKSRRRSNRAYQRTGRGARGAKHFPASCYLRWAPNDAFARLEIAKKPASRAAAR
jgi:hypothetical protein